MKNMSVPRIGAIETMIPMSAETDSLVDRPVKGLASLIHEYEIDGVGVGECAFDFVARKIVKEKFGNRFLLHAIDWKDLLVAPIILNIYLDIDLSTTDYTANYNRVFAKEDNEWKRKKVLQYAETINEEWRPPLFISSSILRKASIANPVKWFLHSRSDEILDNNCPLMVDGSKRIRALTIRGNDKLRSEMILEKEQLVNWLPDTFNRQIRSIMERIKWFPNYQTIRELGIIGGRTSKRYRLLDLTKVSNQTIADFGCNIGQSCLEYYYYGAKEVYGFDVQPEVVEIANLISASLGIGDKVKFFQVDFNDPECFSVMDNILPGQLDLSSFLSVYRTKELTQRERLFDYIIKKTKGIVYFEGHADKLVDTISYYETLFKQFNVTEEFRGYGENRIRPLFQLVKTH